MLNRTLERAIELNVIELDEELVIDDRPIPGAHDYTINPYTTNENHIRQLEHVYSEQYER